MKKRNLCPYFFNMRRVFNFLFALKRYFCAFKWMFLFFHKENHFGNPCFIWHLTTCIWTSFQKTPAYSRVMMVCDRKLKTRQCFQMYDDASVLTNATACKKLFELVWKPLYFLKTSKKQLENLHIPYEFILFFAVLKFRISKKTIQTASNH